MSFTRLRYHIVFGTKHRKPLLTDTVKPKVWGILERCWANNGGQLVEVGGIEDHVHLLGGIRPNTAIETFVKEVKRQSSLRIDDEVSELTGFSWQRSYAVLTVSSWDISDLIGYIRDQEEHHRRDETIETFELSA